jgi:hypothetical protein
MRTMCYSQNAVQAEEPMTAQGDAEASHMQGCLRTPYIIPATRNL